MTRSKSSTKTTCSLGHQQRYFTRYGPVSQWNVFCGLVVSVLTCIVFWEREFAKSLDLESVGNWQENQAGPTKHLVFVVDLCVSDVVGPVVSNLEKPVHLKILHNLSHQSKFK